MRRLQSSAWTVALFFVASLADSAERPNILWITAEDMSPTLGCYGDRYATTPHIDDFAKQSVKYTHAFATAPVCSPSRSTLITGCYATSLGTHQMRSAFPIPDEMVGFPAYLRRAGYYTTNNVKTDYNTANADKIIKASWDDCSDKAHWRNRPETDQPFFSIFNLMTSHQSRTMVWPREKFVEEVQSQLSPEEIHDPAKAPLPPYYVDTPVVRRTVARFYDCVTVMDKQVGELLAQLKEDGLADNTIVFFYSDHGSGMPRHKRCLYDSGMHVPLLIRFPEKWQHLAPKDADKVLSAGDTTDRLVSFVDFGPTVLSLAEVAIPKYMQGEPFLGRSTTPPREYVYGHRDRVDEVIDCSRSVRTKRFLYIRNYMPHLGWNQPTAWPDQGEIRHEFYRLADREKMTDAQWQFAGPARPVTELYDCEQDPQNLVNLADSPQHGRILSKLALAGRVHRGATHGVGLLPEPTAMKLAQEQPLWDLVRSGTLDLDALNLAAAAAGIPQTKMALKGLDSQHDYVRYWSGIAFANRGELGKNSRQALVDALGDTSASVKLAAAQSLAVHGHQQQILPVLNLLLESEDLTTVLYAARTIELMGDDAKAAIPAMKKVLDRAHKIRPPDTPATVVTSGDQDLAMFIGFSASAFLKAVGEEEGEPGATGQSGEASQQGAVQWPTQKADDLAPIKTPAPKPTTPKAKQPALLGAASRSPGRQPGVSKPFPEMAECNVNHRTGTLPKPHPSADTNNCEPAETADDNEDNTITLFDGETLNGWSARAKGDVTVKDGEIQILAKGANLWLVHEGEFANFELTVEAKMPADNYNSGIGFRCRGEGKPKGYQCEVAREKSGMIYAIGSGWVWPKDKSEQAKFKAMAGDAFDNDAWNSFKIRCEGERIQIWVNGTQTADVRDDRFAKGSVALQHHGKGGLHRFRNIRLRKLPVK